MADKKISQLPNGNLTSSTIFPIVTNGITSKTTFSDIQSEIGAGNSYVLGWETNNELGTTVTIGKGIGKIRFTEGSDTFVGVDGANFNDTGIGSIGYSGEMTIILNENQRRYVSIDTIIDNTNGVINMIYFDNQEGNSDSNIWYSTSGDYEYYPYFISSTDGYYSYAEGYATQANGESSHAEGYQTQANGNYSHAEGYQTQAIGNYSHAEGYQTQANGDASHTEGSNTSTTQENSHAGGYQSQANGVASFIHGYNSQVNGNYSIVLGREITGDNDDTTYVDNLNIKRFGSGTLVRSIGVDANGYVVSGTSDSIWTSGTGLGSIMSNSTLCGQTASGSYSLSEGYLTRAEGSYSYAQGYQTRADGDYSHAQGGNTRASGPYSHAQGQNTISSAQTSHAEGFNTVAGAFASHAEGQSTQAEGDSSHAEGIGSIANGQFSHAEGENTRAQGQASHAEGYQTLANGDYSHAGGGETIANGYGSFIHGSGSTVNGEFSIVLGRNITGDTADTTYVDNIDIQKLLTLKVVTNSSPKDGDIWLESNTNTGLKIRISGVTKTITLT